MKIAIITALTLAFIQPIIAQQEQPMFVSNPFPKTISVTGSASLEIIPDEIYVNIELKEYQKKGDNKKDLESIRNQFLAACKSVGIADSLISIASYGGNYYIPKKKRNSELMAGITYQVKFRSSKMMDDLVQKLDDDATQNFQVVNASHSKIIEYRKQLKIQAVAAAREKGIYLCDAIGEKLGQAITINEPVDYRDFSNYQVRQDNYNFNINRVTSSEEGSGAGAGEIDFKKIKLRLEVSVVFAIK